MKFRCHSCLAKYSIPDEKVRNKILKVRCKKCGAMLEVSEKSSITDDVEHPAPTAAAAAVRDPATLPPAAADGAPPRPAAAAGSSPSRGLPRREDGRPAVGRAPQQTPTTGRPALPPLPAIPDVPWFLGVRGQQEGPFSAPQLAARLRRGDYDPGKLLAWREGMERWIKVEQIPELAPYLERRAPTPAEPQRPPTLPPAPHPSTPSSAVMRALGAPPATASPTDRHAAAAGRAAPAAVSGGSGPHVMRPAPPAPATAGRTAPHAASGSSGPHIVRPPGPSSAAPPPPPPPPPPSARPPFATAARELKVPAPPTGRRAAVHPPASVVQPAPPAPQRSISPAAPFLARERPAPPGGACETDGWPAHPLQDDRAAEPWPRLAAGEVDLGLSGELDDLVTASSRALEAIALDRPLPPPAQGIGGEAVSALAAGPPRPAPVLRVPPARTSPARTSSAATSPEQLPAVIVQAPSGWEYRPGGIISDLPTAAAMVSPGLLAQMAPNGLASTEAGVLTSMQGGALPLIQLPDGANLSTAEDLSLAAMVVGEMGRPSAPFFPSVEATPRHHSQELSVIVRLRKENRRFFWVTVLGLPLLLGAAVGIVLFAPRSWFSASHVAQPPGEEASSAVNGPSSPQSAQALPATQPTARPEDPRAASPLAALAANPLDDPSNRQVWEVDPTSPPSRLQQSASGSSGRTGGGSARAEGNGNGNGSRKNHGKGAGARSEGSGEGTSAVLAQLAVLEQGRSSIDLERHLSASANPLPSGLNRGTITNVMKGQLKAVKRCLDRELKRGSKVGNNKVVVSFVIKPNGRADQVEFSESIGDGYFKRCVTKVIVAVNFPSFAGEPIPVSYPLVLTGSL